jgi:hypothetical protein
MRARDGSGTICLSRRKFIVGVGALLAAGTLWRGGGRAVAASAETLPLVRTTFSRLLGRSFRVEGADGAAQDLRLVAVRDLARPAYGAARRTHRTDRETSFSLLFRGSAGPALEQGSYRFAHGQENGFSLFIVPIGPREEAAYYEAIFLRAV